MHLIITLTGKIGNGNKSYFCTTFCGLHNFVKKLFALPDDDIAVWRARSSSWLGDWSSRRTKHHTPEMWRWWRQLRCCGPARYWGHFAKQSSGGVTQHRSGETGTVSGTWQPVTNADTCTPSLVEICWLLYSDVEVCQWTISLLSSFHVCFYLSFFASSLSSLFPSFPWRGHAQSGWRPRGGQLQHLGQRC